MEYDIIYSNRRTLGLSVKDSRLIVRAPYGTPKNKIESAIRAHLDWIEKHISAQKKRAEITDDLDEKEIADLRKKAKVLLSEKTAKYAKIMGLKYGRITITSAKTRFGSCSSKGNIAYSYRLMLYPDAAIDYVVVHELSHLVHMNHSKAFYTLIATVLPDYKERKKLLKL